MKLYALQGNRQALDGGSMFGNCPRALWSRWLSADSEHRVTLSCRCLLVVEPSGRKVLFETGVGAFFEPKMRQRYGVVESEHVLLQSLAAAGFSPEDIDVIVLSHLHFDHAGGLLNAYDAGSDAAEIVFPNARIVVGHAAWQRAQDPHPRDRASFIPHLNALLKNSDKLHTVEPEAQSDALLGPDYSFFFSDGHTPGMMLTRIQTPVGGITFMADLIPGAPWVNLAITMGYDRYPEKLIDEKEQLLARFDGAVSAVSKVSKASKAEWMFFTHDPTWALAQTDKDKAGRNQTRHGIEHPFSVGALELSSQLLNERLLEDR